MKSDNSIANYEQTRTWGASHYYLHGYEVVEGYLLVWQIVEEARAFPGEFYPRTRVSEVREIARFAPHAWDWVRVNVVR